ncbi:MAG TPA: methyltransferase C-terminal domain-containing protein, partial [Gaiellaceae bacterium]|nr:methyltransferase C-terminal domain-containing protein [Gaiellaceae bacterium]
TLLTTLRSEGSRIHIYGASTKGNTILQFAGIDTALVDCAADRNPDKWGSETIGTHIPIVSEDESRALRPDYYLVLPWHFLDEFLDREAAFLAGGGRFIVPLPEVRVLDGRGPC